VAAIVDYRVFGPAGNGKGEESEDLPGNAMAGGGDGGFSTGGAEPSSGPPEISTF